MRRLFRVSYLNAIAGVIALGILGVSADVLWSDRTATWDEAEKSSRNILTAVARDLTSDLELLDLSLNGAIEGLRHLGFQQLPPEIQYNLMFDRAVSASLTGSILILDEEGRLVADAGPVIAPRSFNAADQEYFKVHKERSYVGLYVSRPFKNSLMNDEFSISISRRLAHADGSFAGVVVGSIPLSHINEMFSSLSLGRSGAINLFRSDGVLLTRQPFDPGVVNQNLQDHAQVQEILQGKSGCAKSYSPIDGVQRLIVYERLDRHPLVLTVALSVDEIFAAWKRKAIVLSLVTCLLCSAVVGLTILFQRELTRRTRAETKLRRIARTDDLTKLPNRRGFRETFERDWRQAIRSGSRLSLLYIDADYFKSYNDRYGHGRGDQVLCSIAVALEASIRRPRDIAARYGGEEFAIVLPETDLAGALVIAEKIRQSVIALNVTHDGSPYQVATVSIGVASAKPVRGSVITPLIEAADEALYRAKAGGRNCVRAYEAEDVLCSVEVLPSAAA